MEESADNKSEKPEKTSGDLAHAGVKAVLAAVPLAGGPAAEIFSFLVVPPLEKRRDDWVQSIATGLQELEKRVQEFTLAEASQNEQLITTLVQASRASIATHQEEKLEALRNAVFNSALPGAPEDDLQLMFLNYIDTMTAWHLRILLYCDSPKAVAGRRDIPIKVMAPTRQSVLLYLYPELENQEDLWAYIIEDLISRRLVATGARSGAQIWKSTTTPMGKRFAKFITSPMDGS